LCARAISTRTSRPLSSARVLAFLAARRCSAAATRVMRLIEALCSSVSLASRRACAPSCRDDAERSSF